MFFVHESEDARGDMFLVPKRVGAVSELIVTPAAATFFLESQMQVPACRRIFPLRHNTMRRPL